MKPSPQHRTRTRHVRTCSDAPTRRNYTKHGSRHNVGFTLRSGRCTHNRSGGTGGGRGLDDDGTRRLLCCIPASGADFGRLCLLPRSDTAGGVADVDAVARASAGFSAGVRAGVRAPGACAVESAMAFVFPAILPSALPTTEPPLLPAPLPTLFMLAPAAAAPTRPLGFAHVAGAASTLWASGSDSAGAMDGAGAGVVPSPRLQSRAEAG